MLSSMPAKSATSGDEEGKKDSFDSGDEEGKKDSFDSGDEKNENDVTEDNEEKKDVFDKMFDKEDQPKEDKPPTTDDLDENETKPEEDSTKDGFIAQDTENYREYSLPYNWKKVGHRRQSGPRAWDFYI